MERTRIILNRYKEHNITISRKKLELGTELGIAGHIVRVRLCTDYRELNKMVKRPVHPFPSTREILQAIPVTAKYFAKLDAVHRYFQLALDEESSKLTTFLLPQGKFRYTRAPMGLNASSDEWCSRSDVVIEGLPWTEK